MLPRFRDIEGSTCPNYNLDQCPQIKKSDKIFYFSIVHNFFTVRDNELIFFHRETVDITDYKYMQFNIPYKI